MFYGECRCERCFRMLGLMIKVVLSSLFCRVSLEWRYYFILILFIYEFVSLDFNLILCSNIY